MKKGSILAFALVAAALSQTAGAITATKEYVDRKIGETAPDYATVSNRAMSALQSHQDISGKADKSDTYTKEQTDERIFELAPVPGDYATVSNRAMSAVQPSVSNLFPLARYDNWESYVDYYPPVGAIVYDSRNGRVYRVIAIGWGDGGYPWFPTGETQYFEDITDSGEVPPTIASATNGLAHTSEIPAIVCAVVTNEVHTFGEWVETWEPESYSDVIIYGGPWHEGANDWSISWRPKKGMAFDRWAFSDGDDFAEKLVFSGEFSYTNFTLTLTRTHTVSNTLGLARMSDITNTVTKAYVEGLGIEAGISAETATNIAESVVNATVTGVVRAVSFRVKDYIFDPVTEICWRRQMVDGFLDYIAVTNIDVTLPENYEALEALERARRNQE